MACEVAFIGGPADGVIRVLPEDEPPAEFAVHIGPGAWDLPPTEFRYERQVSQRDTGPLWIYVPSVAGMEARAK